MTERMLSKADWLESQTILASSVRKRVAEGTPSNAYICLNGR